MARTGRPPEKPENLRSRSVLLRLTEREHRQLLADHAAWRAKRTGPASLSEFVRLKLGLDAAR